MNTEKLQFNFFVTTAQKLATEAVALYINNKIEDIKTISELIAASTIESSQIFQYGIYNLGEVKTKSQLIKEDNLLCVKISQSFENGVFYAMTRPLDTLEFELLTYNLKP